MIAHAEIQLSDQRTNTFSNAIALEDMFEEAVLSEVPHIFTQVEL